jgi:hypothetical protein
MKLFLTSAKVFSLPRFSSLEMIDHLHNKTNLLGCVNKESST